jgi:hypothetical protein
MANMGGKLNAASARSLGSALVLCLLLAAAPRVMAAPNSVVVRTLSAGRVAVRPVWGDFKSFWKSFRSSLTTPHRLGQFGVICICLALFILMKR